ncbi:MAG: RT0821/Lpp0805 family surface protein [Pseudomonadota bacterium]|nr:RT0821/Lpp0805 family surface protein [Pseudomonadota bacterium]
MNKLTYLRIILVIFFLSGCSMSDLNRTSLVKTTSTAVGGYLGYEFSDGDLLSTTVGSTVGIIFGDYLADFINQDDYYYFKNETLRVLEVNDNNNSVISGYWRNPKSGNKGVVKIKGYYGSPECRLIENIYVIGDNASNSYGTACRESSGQWAMIK